MHEGTSHADAKGMMPPPISGKMKRQRGEETLTKLELREQELEDQTNLEQREEDLEDLQQISGDVTWKRLLASVGLSSFSAKFANLGIENIDDMAYTTAEKADHTDLVEPDPSPYTYKGEVWDGLWQVERAFGHCPLPQSLSESSRMAYSEPWGGDADARPTKICRLSPKQS